MIGLEARYVTISLIWKSVDSDYISAVSNEQLAWLSLMCDATRSDFEKLPSEEFELTANTLWAHMKTHGKLVLKPLIYLKANSQDMLTLWVLHEFATHTVS